MLKKEIRDLKVKESEIQKKIILSTKDICRKIEKLLEEYTDKYGLEIIKVEILYNENLDGAKKYYVDLKIITYYKKEDK